MVKYQSCNMKFFEDHTKGNKGFSLVELLIAIGIFVVVMTISLGSVVSILDAGRKSKSLKAVMTNLNFALEVMSREIKFGKNYYCGVDTTNPHTATQDCTGSSLAPGTAITFTTSGGVDTIYRLNGTQIEKSTDYGASYMAITAPDVFVQDLKFYVFGTTVYPDTAQPRVLLYMRGYAGTKSTSQSKFYLQTVMSQRAPDL
jgi:prepilin-type N-terminal cleavage/methylation domain-containing protein